MPVYRFVPLTALSTHLRGHAQGALGDSFTNVPALPVQQSHLSLQLPSADLSLPLALMIFVITMLAGCASVPPGAAPLAAPERMETKAPGNGWWNARFVVNWPQGKEPSWYVDPLLAHRVVAPVLLLHRNEIVLWRFHRRAARDQAGHRFSFVFYASSETAREVFAAIKTETLLRDLKKRGVIVQDLYDDTSAINQPRIEDSSDGSWSPAIQKSWPYFIMGVSEMWLQLIAEVTNSAKGGKGGLQTSLDELLTLYEQVNAAVEKMWQNEGQHAFLHHLNALFGYEPLMIREKRLMGF
jgi:hypothetical protein